MKALYLIPILIVLAGCVSDAPHDNPLDAQNGSADLSLNGQVLTYYPPYRPLPGAEVILLPENRLALCDDQGSFAFKNVAPGSFQIIARAQGFAPDTVSLELTASQTQNIHLDALPRFQSVTIRSHHLAQWFPVEDAYYLEIQVRATDPDGLGDVQNVYYSIPDLNFVDTLLAQAQPGQFGKMMAQKELPVTNLSQIIGKTFDFTVTDQPGHQMTSPGHFLPRIVEQTPQLVSPVGLETVSGDTIRFEWQKVYLNYDITFKIELFQINLGVFTLITTIEHIPSTENSYVYTAGLPAGQYFWRVYIVDEFGDTSGSKEAAFQVP